MFRKKLRELSLPGPVGGTRVSGLSDFLLAIPVFWDGFGQGASPVLLGGVTCNGTESFLLSCSHLGIGTYYCSYFQNVGVVCPEGKVIYWVGEGSPYLLS